MNIVPPAAAAAGSRRARKGYERGTAALHFSGKHCRRGTQGQKVHKEVIKQKKLNVHVLCSRTDRGAGASSFPPCGGRGRVCAFRIRLKL